MMVRGEWLRRSATVGAIAGLVLIATPALAGASLQESVLRGVLRHPEVQAAEAEVAMATTEVSMARNAYLPALGASAGPSAAGVGYDVNLSQTVFDWGQTGSQVDQKRALLLRQQANLQVVRDDIALEIIEVYLDVASRRAQLSLIDAYLQRLEALSSMAQTRVEARYSDQAETGRVALAAATTMGLRARLAGELADAASHYALLVGEPADGLRLPDPPAFLEEVRSDGGVDTAIASAPLYRRARLAVQAADAVVREAKASRFPRLALEGSLQRREIGGRMVDDSALGVRLRFNTQQGLSALQRPALEEQRRAAIALEADAVAQDLKRTVQSLEAQDGALDGRITALSDQAEQSEAVREVYREQFLVGRRDIQDLVIMEGEHFEAERQVIELTIDRLRLQYRAAAQLGLLTPALSGDEMQQPAEVGQ